MKKVLWPGLLAGLAMLVVGLAVYTLGGVFFPGMAAEYQNPQLFRPWSDPLMSLMFVHPLILGIVLAWAWDKIKSVSGGYLNFALGVWLVATIPGMLISYGSLPLSLLMVACWTINGLIQSLVGSFVLAKLNK
ncbi:hypothetical protein HZB07_02350 [Candidatus Saganbacteria bacterium]|nr:hypothetical protein [Candidatus Saganbacteria bacterium]